MGNQDIIFTTGIVLDGCLEQDIPMKCPECMTRLGMRHVVGTGEYPKGGYRNTMKPNRTHAIFYECPHCFTKSAMHNIDWSDEDVLMMKLSNIGINDVDKQEKIMRGKGIL